MKGLMIRKIALVSFLVVGSNNMSKIECSEIFAKADKGFLNTESNQLRTESEIINQALCKFKKKIQDKDGHLQRISCRFKMHKGKQLETITKTYFSNYRKKPDYDVETHGAAGVGGLRPDSVIEVIYVKHNQSLSVVHKDGREKKRLSTKQVDLPLGFSA